MDNTLQEKTIKTQQSIKSKDFLNASRQINYTEWVTDSPEDVVARGDHLQMRSIFQVKFETFLDMNKYDAEALKSDTPLYKKILSDFIRQKFVNPENGNTLLHEAALYPSEEMIGELIQLGFDVNAKNNKGETPLMIAARHNNPNIFKLLVETYDANIRLTDHNNMNVMHAAARYMSVDAIRYIASRARDLILGKSKWGYTPLFSAAANGRSDNTLELIRQKANIHAENELGNTALYYAVWAGHEDTAEILCLYGSNPLHKNKEGNTPMDIAVTEGHVELVQKMQNAVFRTSVEKQISSLYQHLNKLNLKIQQMSDTDLRNAFDIKKDFYYDLQRANLRIQQAEHFLSVSQKIANQQNGFNPNTVKPAATQEVIKLINSNQERERS